MEIEGKKVTIIGAIRSGTGAAKLIKQLHGFPFVSDHGSDKKVIAAVEILKQNKIDHEYGRHTEKVFDCDLMIVSPGVPSDAEVILKAVSKRIQVISEIELASTFCNGKIIAITGTNGKTTTTELTGHIFNTAGIKAYVAGNIGLAFSEIVLQVKEAEFVVLEVSSFQIDLIDKFKPDTAVILNITPDHLDRYGNKFENYISSKMRLFKNQHKKNNLILNRDDETLMRNLIPHQSKSYLFSLTDHPKNGTCIEDNKIIFSDNDTTSIIADASSLSIPGEHNLMNALAAVTAAKIYSLDNEKITAALKSFKGVEHRLEFVRSIDGVKFYNDSKATNVDSVWYALRSFNNRLLLILGGEDHGNDYTKIEDLVLSKAKKIYAIGSSAQKVFNFFHKNIKVEIKATLQEAVLAANNEARKNDVILFSPACKSFDMFDNYEHRGRVFKEAVNNL